MTRFNIIGSKALVQDFLMKFDLKPSDSFPVAKYEWLDVNVDVEDEWADEVSDWCEEKGLHCEMV